MGHGAPNPLPGQLAARAPGLIQNTKPAQLRHGGLPLKVPGLFRVVRARGRLPISESYEEFHQLELEEQARKGAGDARPQTRNAKHQEQVVELAPCWGVWVGYTEMCEVATRWITTCL